MRLSVNTSREAGYLPLSLAFFAIITLATIGRQLLIDAYGDKYINILAPFLAPFLLSFYLLAIRVLIRLKSNKWLVRAVFILFNLAIILRLSSLLLTDVIVSKAMLSIGSSLVIMIVLTLIIYRMCVDLFVSDSSLNSKLWAAVCIFFMIAADFGSAYSCLLILHPDALGVVMNHPMEVYVLGIVYSVNVVSGFDPVFQDAADSVKMVAILESTVSTLFLVVLIGRLLGAPLARE